MLLLQMGLLFLNVVDLCVLLVFVAIVVGFLVIFFGVNLIGVGMRRCPSVV